MKKIIFTFVLCLLMQGYVSAETKMKLVPQVLNGQKIVTQENSEAIISHKKESSVALRPPPDGYSLKGRPLIFVSVYGADKSYDFSTEDIQVFVDGNSHRALTYDEFVERIKQRQANEVAIVKAKYDALSRDAAQGAYKPSSNPEAFSPSDKDTVGSMAGGGYKYDVGSLAQSQSQINLEMQAEKAAIEKRTAQELAVAAAIMLKKTTVLPNKWHRGYAAIEKIPDPTKPREVKIIVTVAGEEHEFLLKHLKTQE